MADSFRVKLNFVEFANRTINEMGKMQEALEAAGAVVPWSTADIGFTILAGYLQDIASRAIEINDAPLLALLQDIGAVSLQEDAAQPHTAGAPR